MSVGRHTMPAIHGLMTSKSQELYTDILENVVANNPQFKPMPSMSDWEPALRNGFKESILKSKFMGVGFTLPNVFGQKSVSRCIRTVTDALCSCAKEFIVFPNISGQLMNQQRFYDKSGFPHVIGYIDGTHTYTSTE